jgi:hypothetical protein
VDNVIFMHVKLTRNRLAAAPEMLDSIDDPAPSRVNYLEIAAAMVKAASFFDLILAGKANAAN